MFVSKCFLFVEYLACVDRYSHFERIHASYIKLVKWPGFGIIEKYGKDKCSADNTSL